MTMRDVEGAIAEAVEAGRLNGMDGLNNWQRIVFLIAEADLFVDLAAYMGNFENEQALAAAVFNRLGYDYRTVADYVFRCMDRPSERNE